MKYISQRSTLKMQMIRAKAPVIRPLETFLSKWITQDEVTNISGMQIHRCFREPDSKSHPRSLARRVTAGASELSMDTFPGNCSRLLLPRQDESAEPPTPCLERGSMFLPDTVVSRSNIRPGYCPGTETAAFEDT